MDELLIAGMIVAFAVIGIGIMIWGVRGARAVVDAADETLDPWEWRCPKCGAVRYAQFDDDRGQLAATHRQEHELSHYLDEP